MKKLSFFYLALLFSVFIVSCKEETVVKPTYNLSQDFLNYVDYPINSYWVMKDSASQTLDTLLLISSSKRIIETPKYAYKDEVIEQNFYSSRYNKFFGGLGTLYDITDQTGWYRGYGVFFNGAKDDILGNFCYLYQTYDSLLVANKWYTNVKCYEYLDTDRNVLYQSYWSKGVGVIKQYETPQDYDTTLVWNLVEHHIAN